MTKRSGTPADLPLLTHLVFRSAAAADLLLLKTIGQIGLTPGVRFSLGMAGIF